MVDLAKRLLDKFFLSLKATFVAFFNIMTYYKLKSNIIYRDYKDYGILTDNYRFSYMPYENYYVDAGSITISESGNTIISLMKDTIVSLNFIFEKLVDLYEINKSEIEEFVLSFLNDLKERGFICEGKSIKDCLANDFHFDYLEKKKKELKKGFINKGTNDTTFEDKLTSLHLEIASACNEKCIHCFIPPEFKTSVMSLDLFNNILSEAIKLNIFHITLSGGEPMTNPNFLSFLKLCREKNFSVNVLSNLQLLDDEIIFEMKKNPLLSVQTSLYAISNEIHDSITNVIGSCENTKSAILKLKSNNIPLQISCPLMKQNKNEFIKVLGWAKSKNICVITELALIAEFNHKMENIKNRLSIQDIESLLEQINLYDKNYYKSLKVQTCITTKSNYRICSILHDSMGILPNGDTFPCPGWENFNLGNIKSTSLETIWRSSEKAKLLRSLTRKKFQKCNDCKDKLFCSPCLLRNANESSNGNFMEIQSYFCDFAKAKHNKYLTLGKKYEKNRMD